MQVNKVNPRLASASLLCVNTQPLTDSFSGIIRWVSRSSNLIVKSNDPLNHTINNVCAARRQQDVRATEIDKVSASHGIDSLPGHACRLHRQLPNKCTSLLQVEMYSCFRPGDLVRAEVISLGDSRSYYLSTAKNDLGVVYAKSLNGELCTTLHIRFLQLLQLPM